VCEKQLGMTALMSVAQHGQYEQAQLLLECEDINLKLCTFEVFIQEKERTTKKKRKKVHMYIAHTN
jgi:hypothetical protein